MRKKALLCCLSLCLVSVIVSAARDSDGFENLKNITDLKKNPNFGKTYPRHGLMLLHWFANNINIDQNEVIRLNFDPCVPGYYGCHQYKNYEQNFPRLRSGMMYYSLGNLNPNLGNGFPNYVTQDYYNSPRNQNRNIDRLLISVPSRSRRTVHAIYITNHYADNRGSAYDRSNTFRVDVSLLEQIRDLNRNDVCHVGNFFDNSCEYMSNQQEVTALHNVYANMTNGCAWFMILAGYDNDNSQRPICLNSGTHSSHGNRSTRSTGTKYMCEAHNKLKVEVKPFSDGYARILWSGIPENILRMKGNIGLYKDEQLLKNWPLNERIYGTIDTSWPLNPGLQAKLTISDKVIWAGPEFDEANGVLPTNIRGYKAFLELYTADGYACARLFIEKSFSNWQTVFKNSWVGFYKSTLDDNRSHKTYQWATYFEKNSDQDFSEDYDIFEYKSSLAMSPGVQIRFLKEGYTNKISHTEPWEGVINPKTSSEHDELRKR